VTENRLSADRLGLGHSHGDLLHVGEDVLSLLQRLVRYPSTHPGSATDGALAALLEYLELAGVHGEIISCGADGAPMARATIVGAEPGPSILFQGHIDVIAPDVGWDRDPFGAEFQDGLVHGRGTVDMKSGLTAFASAMAGLRSHGLPRGSLTLLVDSDEETGSDRGLIPYLAEHGPAAYDWAICGEPTALCPYLGNRGLVWARIEAKGKASHAGMPYTGRNPIPVITRILDALPAPPTLAAPYGASGPSLTPTTVHAGAAVNAIPDNAILTIDRRLVPGEDAGQVADQLRKAVSEAATAAAGFNVRFEVLKSWPVCLLDEDTVLARTAQAVTRRWGHEAGFGFDDACNDASFLSQAGVPTLVWGPGDPQLAHASNERVELTQVEQAAAMYAEAVLALLAEGPAGE
jgi:acetylornithine deacetylase/succinyl-diaminopimelate desuccinylase-like protein